MNLFEQAYEYINEVASHEQNHIKLIKWAISVHFNSAAGEGEENERVTIPSRIGYYFSTIRYKDYVINYEPKITGKFAQLALFYTCNYNRIVGTKQQTVDKRQFTIVYAIGDVVGLKDEIKHNPTIRKCFEKDDPAPNFFDPKFKSEMHRIAEEYVLYAKFYWKNDDADALIVWQKDLPNLGEIIKKSDFAVASSPNFRNKTPGVRQIDNGPRSALYITIPLDKKREFLSKIVYSNMTYGINHRPIPTTYDDVEHNKLYIAVTKNDYFDKLRQKIEEEGFAKADSWTEISLMNASGKTVRKDLWGCSAIKQVLMGMANGTLGSTGRKPNSRGEESTPRLAKETTLACDSASFERIAQMASRIVNMYNADHKTNANVEANDEAESLTITGLSQKALDTLISALDKRGFKYTKM